MEISSNHHNFQTVRARDLKFLHNVHHPLCVMCHMSHVKKNSNFFFILNKIGQSGGAGRWRVCYQRGLPRLVSPHPADIADGGTSSGWLTFP